MSFCSHQLMEMLAVKSEKTALLLTTLGEAEQHDRMQGPQAGRFLLGRAQFELPTIFSIPKQPVKTASHNMRIHAHKVPWDWLNHPVGAVWYQPHDPVLVRVMFDCPAKYQG
ncbi:hypothetical protein OS493_011688 [Desmophyllum pertusum]|uniref:Uncharacterized protein n=1 Tax=Desmophyllum pertusum TaxID=174260 RepID=A0A9X0CH11_9CNID|nr:hypothetical protein OS493_011688 [Desmophyllum pertusum]